MRALVIVLLLAQATAAGAQPRTGTRPDYRPVFYPAEFLEKSYVFYSLPAPDPNPTGYGPEGARPAKTGWLIFEAQPALHLFFWNRMAQIIKSGQDDWAFVPSFTLITQIRFLNTTSDPVRTPSFMPIFNFQWFHFSRPRWVKFLETELVFRLGHHSNGQEFCRFAAGHLDDGHCPAFDVGHPDYGQTNLINGDFETNFVVLGHHARLVTEVDGNNFAASSWAYGVTFESNPRFWPFNHLPGHIDDQIYALYGPHRFHFEAEHLRLTDVLLRDEHPWSIGHLRFRATADAILGTGPGVAPYRASLEASRTFLRLGGTGLFVRAFSGQDYYNLHFVHRIDFQVQAGFMFDFSAPLYLGLPAPPS
jgi:hypothetical protein